MRRAFIGLSTPLFYDYSVSVKKAKSDTASSPNPILDSPFGLMIFFDELWFLCESLCPENMRNLEFVKYLDETKLLPNLYEIENSELPNTIKNTKLDAKISEYTSKSFEQYRDVLISTGVDWDSRSDNHTHMLNIGDYQTHASSIGVGNIMFDIAIVNRIESLNLELITNSFTQNLFETNEVFSYTKLTERMVIDDIPNYLTQNGPYHPVIDELRDNEFLSDFRIWIEKKLQNATFADIQEIKKNVETAIRNEMEKDFLEKFSTKKCFTSIGKTMTMTVLGELIPVVGALDSVNEIRSEFTRFANDNNRRWQGFIVSSKQSMRKINS